MRRTITIKYVDFMTNEELTIESEFDSEITKDSEALHIMLCYNNPGNEYTVSFKNVKEN